MKLRTRLWLTLSVLFAVFFIVDMGVTWHNTREAQRIEQQNTARMIHEIVTSVQKVYQGQFIASGLPINEWTVGLLPVHTIPLIAKDYLERASNGAVFKTVSDRPRNPANQADAQELEEMAYFRANPKLVDRMRHIKTADGKAWIQFSSPFWMDAQCLTCHGKREDAPKYIADTYTTAWDYKLGDLYGVLSIRLPSAPFEAAMWARFKMQMLRDGMAFVLLFVALGWVVERFLIARAKQLAARAERVLSTEFAEEEEEEEEAQDELAVVDQVLRQSRRQAQSILRMARRTRALAARAEQVLSAEFAEEEEEEEEAQDELGGVARALRTARQYAREVRAKNWVQTGLAEFSKQTRGNFVLETMAAQAMGTLARYVDAQMGAVFVRDGATLRLAGGYAWPAGIADTFALGEGLIGQVALDQKTLQVDAPEEGYLHIFVPGQGKVVLRHCLIVPLVYEGEIKGVIELASLHPFDPPAQTLVQQAADVLAVTLLMLTTMHRSAATGAQSC